MASRPCSSVWSPAKTNLLRRPRTIKRVRLLTWFFICGLVVSGATAIPLIPELEFVVQYLPVSGGMLIWLASVLNALKEVDARYPFLAYGTDWLAFGHFAIAIAFVGALKDPVRNIWVYKFGMICCVLVVPYALVFGAIRGIPFDWRLIDCSFGVFGIVPLWYCVEQLNIIEQLDRG